MPGTTIQRWVCTNFVASAARYGWRRNPADRGSGSARACANARGQRSDSLTPMDSWRGPSVPHLPGRGPETKIADTASWELTVAAAGPAATLYALRITPYDATHIGHAATFIAWDLLVRAWRDAGHAVMYVQNVTDVDDPLLERATSDGEDWRGAAASESGLVPPHREG